MNDDEQKRIFASNLNTLLEAHNKIQREVASDIGVSPQTFNTWCQGIAIPRMGKIQRLADYFRVPKSALLDLPPSSSGSEEDALTDSEREHLEAYRRLNREGQREADEHLAYLNTKEEYKRLPEGIIKKSEIAG